MTERRVSRTAVVVTSYPGQTRPAEAHRLAREGILPRSAPVQVARALDADVIDVHYMSERATRPSQVVARRLGLPAGQVVETLMRRRRYRHVLAWADRIGLPLSAASKILRSGQDVVLISVDLSGPKKAWLLSRLRSHSHLRAIVGSSSVQMELARCELGVPASKLRFLPPGVDTEFWRSSAIPTGRRFCSVGWESRDYGTFVRAADELDAAVEVALGSSVFSLPSDAAAPEQSSGRTSEAPIDLESFASLKGTQGYRTLEASLEQMGTTDLPRNIAWHQQLKPLQLRQMYDRSQFVVIPLHDVSFDAGYTATLEAMAMGRPVIITRTRGQVDVVEDGVHGLYVPVGDPGALKRAMERLLSSPQECQRMGAAARRRVEERYGLDRYVGELVALMRQDTAPSGDRPPGRSTWPTAAPELPTRASEQ